MQEIRDHADKDYYYFCKYILNNDLMQEQPHEEMCNFVSTWEENRKKLILVPRGGFKSTVITVGYTIWRILQDRNIRILISSENHSNSCKYLGEIKQQFETNTNLHELYGYLKNQDRTGWRKDEIVVNGRTRTGGKEPTVSVASVGQTRVGMH